MGALDTNISCLLTTGLMFWCFPFTGSCHVKDFVKDANAHVQLKGNGSGVQEQRLSVVYDELSAKNLTAGTWLVIVVCYSLLTVFFQPSEISSLADVAVQLQQSIGFIRHDIQLPR